MQKQYYNGSLLGGKTHTQKDLHHISHSIVWGCVGPHGSERAVVGCYPGPCPCETALRLCFVCLAWFFIVKTRFLQSWRRPADLGAMKASWTEEASTKTAYTKVAKMREGCPPLSAHHAERSRASNAKLLSPGALPTPDISDLSPGSFGTCLLTCVRSLLELSGGARARTA